MKPLTHIDKGSFRATITQTHELMKPEKKNVQRGKRLEVELRLL